MLALALLLPATAAARVAIAPVSGADPYSSSCGGFAPGGYIHGIHTDNSVAADPAHPARAVAAWMQDDPLAVVTAFTSNRGRNWRQVVPPGLSACDGGDDVNGDERVAMARDGTAYLSALISHYGGPNVSDGQIVVSRATPGGRWSKPTAVTPEDGTYRHQTMLAVDPRDPDRVYVAWIEWIGTAGVYFAKSNDGGRTFSRPSKIFAVRADQALPLGGTIAPRADGSLLVGFEVTPDGLSLDPVGLRKTFYVLRSPNHGRSWQAPVRVGTGSFNPALNLSDPVPWLPGSGGAMSASPKGPVYAASASVRLPGDRGSVKVYRSLDGGRHWATLPALRSDGPGAVGEATIATTRGLVGACWYDGLATDSRLTWPLTFRCATSGNRGEHWRSRQVAGPFDLALAPVVLARRSLGDNTGLTPSGSGFLSTFNVTSSAGGEPARLLSARFP
jgi:hypothetical protein